MQCYNKINECMQRRYHEYQKMYRRLHYGEQAFQALLKYLEVSTMDVEVLSWNEGGLRFWEKMNFRERSKYMRYQGEESL